MHGLDVGIDSKSPKAVELGEAVIIVWDNAVVVHRLAKDMRPDGHVNCIGPTGLGKQKHLAGGLRQVADGLLSNAILEVSVDTTEGQSLATRMAVCHKGIVLESAIVGMIVLDGDSVVAGKAFEGLLGTDSVLTGH